MKFPKAHWNGKMTKHVQQGKNSIEVLQRNRNIDVVIKDTDKNVGPVCADKETGIKENRSTST